MDTYVGMIALFGFKFAPYGWAICDGSLIEINQNQMLYSVIGMTYGGDLNRGLFGLPDLRGRLPVCMDKMYPLGTLAGAESVRLSGEELAAHSHRVFASFTPGTPTSIPGPAVQFGVAGTGIDLYAPQPGPKSSLLSPTTIGVTGGVRPHDNMMPTLVGNYCIALQGEYPPPAN